MTHWFKTVCAITLVSALLAATTAQASLVTWVFSGEFTGTGVFSNFDIGDDSTVEITFDATQQGVTTGLNTLYSGTATFTSLAASYIATDATATIQISDSPNIIEISLSAPDASLPDLEFNVGGSGSVSTIRLTLDPVQDIGSENIIDYLNISDLALDSAVGLLIVPSSAPPIFSITSAVSDWIFGDSFGE
jgi:hypothetical protein